MTNIFSTGKKTDVENLCRYLENATWNKGPDTARDRRWSIFRDNIHKGINLFVPKVKRAKNF